MQRTACDRDWAAFAERRRRQRRLTRNLDRRLTTAGLLLVAGMVLLSMFEGA